MQRGSRWLRVATDPVRDPNGEVAGAAIIISDITQNKEHEAEIDDLNQRLRRAITESQHRIKNNLQVLAAFVDMRVLSHEEFVPTSALQGIGQHIRALAALHDMLTAESRQGGEIHQMSVMDTLRKLGAMMQPTVGGRCIKVTGEDIFLPLKQTSSLALFVNECVQNSLKHAAGDIELNVEREGNNVHLDVTDHGPGFPPSFDPNANGNTGLELMESLGRWDLQGEITYANLATGGARVRLEFPLAPESGAGTP